MGWGVLETKEFKEYCRRRGWGEIDVTVTTAVGDYFQKYIASTIAGEGADVIIVGSNDVPYFADHGLIEPLDDYIETWDAHREGRISDEVLKLCRGGRQDSGSAFYLTGPDVLRGAAGLAGEAGAFGARNL